jgi:hypothetical protein
MRQDNFTPVGSLNVAIAAALASHLSLKAPAQAAPAFAFQMTYSDFIRWQDKQGDSV